MLGCGSRFYDDFDTVFSTLEQLHRKRGIKVVIHGACRGADKLIDKAAKKLGIPRLPFPADWKRFGKAAGPIRNREMHHKGKPDLVVAFHPDLESSRGTLDMVTLARKKGTKVKVVK